MVTNAADAGDGVPVLRTKGLTRRFHDLVAVDSLSLSIGSGELLALLGPNGAGKTTLMRMLCGVLRPDDGDLHLFGAKVTSLGAAQRARVGYCPQALVVWRDLTCSEQLVLVGRMYGLNRAAAQNRARSLLEMLGLGHRADERAQNLSGGMRRRLSIALALTHDPDFLILDEPAAG
ncbi:MAG: ABC transporter ATP-binding protein, partial [Deltaproteobacteria bacterium]|nr:ABC transporter ATP-binding protein [Deltaproteobacteria bacterium]